MRVLSRLAKAKAGHLAVHLFGCDESNPLFQALERGFEYQNDGILTRRAVSNLLAQCDVFVDLSDYQAYVLEVVRRQYRGWELQGSYTWSKSVGNGEDFGQVAYYQGSLGEHPHAFALDDHHNFKAQQPMLVCGNTADMITRTRYAKNFFVAGDKTRHFGLFDCGPAPGSAAGGVAPGACC